jgi:predicted dienelactone hydrolase
VGYVVVALDAPRDAPLLLFPDGRVVTGPLSDDEDYIWPRVADVSFLLDQLPSLNTNGPLRSLLDLTAVGMFGGSRGGYLSNIMAAVDDRIKAAVNKDGFLWGL